jgi:tRNA(Ile)-lysidine synthase
MNSFESTVAAAVGIGFRGKTLLAAVSGGADSTAMLWALAAIRPQAGFTLHCLQVDHGIRPETERRGDAEFVAALCEKRGIPCRIALVPPGRVAETAKKRGLGIEAAARLYRRRAWNREARRIGAALILVAHTRDDALETALMRFLRGSGPGGLAAMPARRGRILRPLRELGRADVLRYLEEEGLSFRTDPSNRDNRFLRNALRNRLIPLLDDLFPFWKTGVESLAQTQRRTAEFLTAEAAARVRWEAAAGGRELHTGAADFFCLPPILREEALFQGIDRLSAPGGLSGGRNRRGGVEKPRPVKRSTLRVFSEGGRTALDLGPCRVRKTASLVILAAGDGKPHEAGCSLLIKAPGLYKLGGVTFELRPVFKTGDRESPGEGFFTALPMILRRSFSGDRLLLGGRKTGPADMKRPAAGLLCAADTSGIAAFIGLEGPGQAALLLTRETEKNGPSAGIYYCKLSNTTGGC